MTSKNTSKTKKLNGVTLTKAIELMSRNIKSGNTIYIAFPKKTFQLLIFTLTMSIVANAIIAYLIIEFQTFVSGIYTFVYIILFILSITTVLSGLYIVFKGIDIITDETDKN